MSQMFETDVSKWFPADAPVTTEEKVAELGKVVGFLATTLHSAFERIEQVSADNKKLLGLIEQTSAVHKTTGKRLDLSDDISRLRAEMMDLARERTDALEELVAKCCDKLNIPVPFPGQDSDFGLAPKPKKERDQS